MTDEAALIDEIRTDCRESSGSCGRETDGIVTRAISHLISGNGSSDFEAALEEYRDQLHCNVEDASSQRNHQRIRAGQMRTQGIFFLDDAWGRLLTDWIAANEDMLPVVVALDDTFRLAPKAKPTKKWASCVQALFEEHSEDAVLGVIRTWIGILIDADQVRSRGICYDSEQKLRAMVLILSANRHEEDGLLLRRLAERVYAKIPDHGPMSSAVGNACLQALSELSGTLGLIQLNELASQLKYPTNAADLAEKKLAEAAGQRGIDVGDLQDMAIPDHGLSD